MGKDLIARYIWLVDTLKSYRKLTRAQIDTLWQRSSLSGGEPLPERTFYHYRRAIEENFHIDIKCTPSGEYYIDREGSDTLRNLSNWLVDSYAVNDMLRQPQTAMERVEVEDVPSARMYLPKVFEAVKNNNRISFSYQGFSRSRPDEDILFCPYFLKRYKQRWYMYGLRENTGDLRTYALDRITAMRIENSQYRLPTDMDAQDVFGHIIGITSSQAEVRNVRLRATPAQAKYLRALPLHKTQSEVAESAYSIFCYRLKLNYELVQEIMALGPEVQVLEPPELVAMVRTRLKETLNRYNDPVS